MLSHLLLAAACLISAPTGNEKPKDEPAKNYRIDASGTTTTVKPGGSGTFKLKISPAEGFHLSAEAPTKIALKSDALKLKKEALTYADAEDQKAKDAVFSVGFDAPMKGKSTISADAIFFVCSETVCERKTEKLTVAVDVKP